LAKIEDRLEVLDSILKGKKHLPKSPVDLAVLDHPGYEIPPHIQLLNEKLLAVANGEITRLIVQMPPRHGKSELISHYFPAWMLAHDPTSRIMLVGYEADFISSFGRKIKNTIQEHQNLLGIRLDDTSASRYRFDLAHHTGGLVTAGILGAITGKGSSVLIIDDPVRGSADAGSKTQMDALWEWFKSTAYTRLEKNGRVILVNTRWSTLDLSGRLLEAMETGGDYWDVVSLPALAEENDLLNRKVGEALWPSLFPSNVLMEKKRMVGSYWWASLYQQRPSPLGGGLFKSEWVKYYNSQNLPDDLVVYMGVDLAISQKETADYTAISVVGQSQDTLEMYVLDFVRERMDFPSTIRKINEVAARYNPNLIGIESVAYQAAVPQMLKECTSLPIKDIKTIRDKVTRFTTRFVVFENSKIFLKNDHPLNDTFLDEFVYFPKSKHDDLLDSLEIALGLATGGGNPYTESYQYYEDCKRDRMVASGDWRSRYRR
jgi:predicted phage terminase large subunit-like protein